MSNALTASVTTLPGIGKVRAAAYERMGIRTVEQLLYHFPRAYENRGSIVTLATAPEGERCATLLTIATEPRVSLIRRGMSLLKFRAYDDSGTAEITYFNQDYLKNTFHLGATYRFYGKVERFAGGRVKQFTLSSPAAESWDEDKPLPALYPVYPLTEGLSQKQIAQNMASALSMTAENRGDALPDDIRHDMELATLSYALRNIHAPEDLPSLAIAKRRLIFDEFFRFSLGTAIMARQARTACAVACTQNDLSDFRAALPYALTGAQNRVIEDIGRDMSSTIPMRRIIVGDVGCGKTVCAAAAMLIAVRSGRQAMLMAPTEILARQHAADLTELFTPMGLRVALLIGATPAAQKKAIYEALASPDPARRIDMVVGTHALLTEGVTLAAPALVITDEQHRFGAGQRAALAEKNRDMHMLVMSATPIPRTMALMLYGDLDLSRIDEMPPGRQRVDTFVVGESYRARLQAFIRKQVDEGGQVYIVCPAIEERECEPDEITLDELFSQESASRPPLKAAVTYTEELRDAIPELRDSIAYLHGGMKSREKDDIMQRFAAGQIKVLVSTTVIEVGVNVPNANLMIVENAERFGLSQLHQLRGRVGRGQRKSYCVLVSDAQGETARKRLETMRTTYDGYRIAEEDLALRGPGDFFRVGSGDAIRQSGGIRFRLADLCDDSALMTSAATAARDLLTRDPELRDHPQLRRSVEELFCADIGTLS